jgi:TrmH family RNA methyltransferase
MAGVKTITSRDNPSYKLLKRLAGSAQARKAEGLAVLDGPHLVAACLAHWGPPELLVVSESGFARPEISRLAEAAGSHTVLLADALFHSLRTVQHETGVMAAVRRPQTALPAAITGDCLLVDQLQDPGNLGSLLRTAAAAGVRDIFCSPGTVDLWSPKVLRAGQGAHFGLTLLADVPLAEVFARLRVPSLATSSHAAASVYSADLTRPVAWVFGNEGAGIAPEVLAQVTGTVSIPMPGAIESLNVSAAAAICLFESVRQRLARS